MKMQVLSKFIMLSSCLILNSGCSLRECRNDLEVFGGFYCTSYVDHIGARSFEVTKIYESPDIICAEARLVQWERSSKRIDLGKRLIFESKVEFANDIKKQVSQIKKHPTGNYIYLGEIPVAVNWQEEQIDFRTARKWCLYPDNLYETISDSVIEDSIKSMQLTPSSTENQGIIFNNEDINCTVYLHFEDPYYKPFRSNLLKTILYPPATVADAATLPIIILWIPVCFIVHFSNYGPGP